MGQGPPNSTPTSCARPGSTSPPYGWPAWSTTSYCWTVCATPRQSTSQAPWPSTRCGRRFTAAEPTAAQVLHGTPCQHGNHSGWPASTRAAGVRSRRGPDAQDTRLRPRHPPLLGWSKPHSTLRTPAERQGAGERPTSERDREPAVGELPQRPSLGTPPRPATPKRQNVTRSRPRTAAHDQHQKPQTSRCRPPDQPLQDGGSSL